MTTPLDDTRERLARAGERHQAALDELEAARDAVRPLVVEGLRLGMTQTEAAKLSRYTRETIRGLARVAGIGSRRR